MFFCIFVYHTDMSYQNLMAPEARGRPVCLAKISGDDLMGAQVCMHWRTWSIGARGQWAHLVNGRTWSFILLLNGSCTGACSIGHSLSNSICTAIIYNFNGQGVCICVFVCLCFNLLALCVMMIYITLITDYRRGDVSTLRCTR